MGQGLGGIDCGPPTRRYAERARADERRRVRIEPGPWRPRRERYERERGRAGEDRRDRARRTEPRRTCYGFPAVSLAAAAGAAGGGGVLGFEPGAAALLVA